MRLHEVGFRYGRRGAWVLRGVTVSIDPGEIVIVRGRNGVGKSTLLGVIAGILRAQHGDILDRPGRIGWVPEHFPADQPFTVGAYLETMAELRGATTAEVNRWVSRLGLAQALLVPPDLLLLDEPWEGLDDATRDLVPGIVAEVLQAGGAVVVSDHSGDTDRLVGAVEWTVEEGVVTVDRPATEEPK